MTAAMDQETAAQPLAEVAAVGAQEVIAEALPAVTESSGVEAAADGIVEEDQSPTQQREASMAVCEEAVETEPAEEQSVESTAGVMVDNDAAEKRSPPKENAVDLAEGQSNKEETAEQSALAEEKPDDLAAEAQPPEAPMAQQVVQTATPRQLKPRGANLKRKREVDDLKRKAERLEAEADLAERAVREEAAVVAEMAEELRQRQAALQAREEGAAASRRAATKARREVAYHELPPVREKPVSTWAYFLKEIGPTLAAEPSQRRILSRAGDLWAKMSAEDKQKYRDMHDQEVAEYQAWERSEEGREILAKRREALRMQQAAAATHSSELGAHAHDSSEPNEKGQEVSPAKRDRRAEPGTTPIKTRSKADSQRNETGQQVPLAKRGRPAGPRLTPISASPTIEDSVLEEAFKLSLKEPLLNLASRPEVQALKRSSEELLQALKGNAGMVNAAKRHLLAEAA